MFPIVTCSSLYMPWYICSAPFRNLRFLQKALRFLGIPRKRTMGSALFRNLRFLGILRTLTLVLAQVGAAISTVAHWGTVEMAAQTWARARVRAKVLVLGLGRVQRVCVRTFRSALRFLGIPRNCSAFCRKRRFLKSAEHIILYQ